MLSSKYVKNAYTGIIILFYFNTYVRYLYNSILVNMVYLTKSE